MPGHRTVKRPPLVESMFELRWNASAGDNVFDEYRLSLGRVFEKLKVRYPRHERLVELPRELYFATPPARAVVFDRFMPVGAQGQLGYPLVQYGPGVATVNSDNTAYDWRGRVQPEIENTYAMLVGVHDGLAERVESVLLRSLDLFDLPNDAAAREFLTKRLRIKVESVIDESNAVANATAIPSYACVWRIPDGPITLRVTAGWGQAAGRTGVLLDISSEVAGDVLRNRGLKATVELGHKLIGDAFFALLSGELADDIGYQRNRD